MEVVISSFDAEGAVVCSEEKGEKSGNYGMNGSNHGDVVLTEVLLGSGKFEASWPRT
jgi:hypothetical protein